ncbi:uncharacterized protein [Blastocystis hominis]|uniref:CENP-T/Histone H4 histone fold domain-containing protein n=1 Tax=Blastocystis hominis TaxID=12968 RepID=D8MAX9_BLAHO|nr:uncharacterized protein [Blastocystis hominis]CBK25218.2 unnamed protein product [Blastocystis hominis]|eukprot:XP_012899266.1 uncharacterized protein [Blastocystis hominis]
MGDIPFANSQEERTLRELLIPSQPSQLGEATSLLEPSIMPPPSSSLSSRLRIPNRTKIHTHRKSSEFLALRLDLIHRSGEMSLALIKKLVMANCSRRVGKEVFEEVNQITSEFFDSISDRLVDYCSLGERRTVNVDDVKLLMHRQRLTSKQKSFEDLVRENLNKQQIDALISVPEHEMEVQEVGDYL